MKKKQVMALFLATVLAATSVTACGKQADPEQPAVEETEEATEAEEVAEEPEEKEPVCETVQYTVQVTAANEDGSFAAYDESKQEYVLTLSENLSEEEKALVAEGAVLLVSTEVLVEDEAEMSADEVPESPEGTETETEPEETSKDEETAEEVPAEPIRISVTAVAAVEDEAAVAKVSEAVFEVVNGFTVEKQDPAAMFAKQEVNVRKGPSGDYDKIGSLNFADEVSVTGVASTGWYQIDYNGEVGYVSNNYVQETKPEPKQVAAAPSQSSPETAAPAGNTTASAPAPSTPSSGGGSYQERYDALVAAGDWDGVLKLMEEMTAAGAGATPGAPVEGTKSTYTSVEFVNYLNSQRESMGLGTLSWSDSLASNAVVRAEEISSDFSHNGAKYAEIILSDQLNDVGTWYNRWYNSSGHRDIMLGNYSSAAAAVCFTRNTYFVICVFK